MLEALLMAGRQAKSSIGNARQLVLPLRQQSRQLAGAHRPRQARPPVLPRTQAATSSVMASGARPASTNAAVGGGQPQLWPAAAADDELPFRDYTAAANAAYWNTRPVAVARRAVQIGVALGDWFLQGFVGARIGGDAQALTDARAEKLRRTLTDLGPAFVKIGQAVSSRPDVAPPEFLRELEKLQDQIPPFDSTAAFAVIQSELGAPAAAVFSAISAEPVAAASLGQVYKAVLRSDGRDVAVKVQRPGVATSIALDIFILRQLAAWFRRWRRLNTDLPALLDEWATSLFKELDYRTEAANGVRFARLYSHLEGVYVPKMDTQLTTRKVLIMEWVHGERLRTAYTAASHLAASSSSDDLRLVEVGVRCSLEQMLEDGFYHADPHPGNLLRTKDGQLAWIDYGMMGEIDYGTRKALMRATLHLVNREFEALADDFVSLGMLPEDSDPALVVPALTSVFAEALKGGVSNLSFGDLSTQLGRTMYQFKFRIPSYYTLLVRSLSVLEGIALASDPNYKVLGAAYPWIARRLLTDTSPELRGTLMALLYKGGRFNFRRMESLISQAVRPSGRPQPRRNPRPGESAVQRGDALALLLSPEGEFVRSVVIEELAKGVDAAWRLAADSTVSSVREQLLTLVANGGSSSLGGGPFGQPGPGGTSSSSTSSSSSGGMGAGPGPACAASIPGSGPVAQALLELLATLPQLADEDDREQVEGISRLAKVLQESTAGQRQQQGDWFGDAASAAASSSFISGTPLEAAAEALDTSVAIMRWLAVEVQTLTPAERTEALRIPISIGQAVSSRAAARAIRWVLVGDPLVRPAAGSEAPGPSSSSASSSSSSSRSSSSPTASASRPSGSRAGAAVVQPTSRSAGNDGPRPVMRPLSKVSSVGSCPSGRQYRAGGFAGNTLIVRPTCTASPASHSRNRS